MSPRRHLRTRYPTPAPAEPVTADAPAPRGERGPPSAAVEVPVAVLSGPPVAIEVEPAREPAAFAEPSRPRRHRVRASAYLVGLALTAFGTGLLVFNSFVMPRLIHGIGQVEVPDLRNLTLDQAERALRPLDLQLSRAGERFDPAVPRGFILSQDPSFGAGVRGGRRVSVVVSLGEEFSSVPEVSGESQRSAEQLIRSAGLRLGAITRAPSEDVGEGLVAGSDPGPESVLPQGGALSLLISSGAGEEDFVMPDLVGREITGVRRQLEALGFRVLTPPGTAFLGTIVAQRPPAGSRITGGAEISLQATGRIIR